MGEENAARRLTGILPLHVVVECVPSPAGVDDFKVGGGEVGGGKEDGGEARER